MTRSPICRHLPACSDRSYEHLKSGSKSAEERSRTDFADSIDDLDCVVDAERLRLELSTATAEHGEDSKVSHSAVAEGAGNKEIKPKVGACPV